MSSLLREKRREKREERRERERENREEERREERRRDRKKRESKKDIQRARTTEKVENTSVCRFKTPPCPCVRSRRLRVYPENARMC